MGRENNRVDITELSLCAGVGWLSLGIELAAEYLGWPYRCMGHCERDSYAAAVLLARMEDASLGRAPVFAGNLEDLDARTLRGHVNLISAGFPCQPWSAAGKQKGTEDARWLWPAIANIIREVGPELVFLENVPGIVSGGGLDYVLSDLAEMRFDAEWLSVAAAEAGASHKRDRVFILAYRNDSRFQRSGKRQRKPRHVTQRDQPLADSRHDAGHAELVHEPGSELRRGTPAIDTVRLGPGGSVVANAGRERIRERDDAGDSGPESVGPEREDGDPKCSVPRDGTRQKPPAELGRDRPSIASDSLADSKRNRQRGRRRYDAIEFNQCDNGPVFAPGPADPRWPGILAARPWLAPAIESGLCVMADGSPVVVDASRADQLRCSGNGVVAIQAACAFVELVRRAGIAG